MKTLKSLLFFAMLGVVIVTPQTADFSADKEVPEPESVIVEV